MCIQIHFQILGSYFRYSQYSEFSYSESRNEFCCWFQKFSAEKRIFSMIYCKEVATPAPHLYELFLGSDFKSSRYSEFSNSESTFRIWSDFTYSQLSNFSSYNLFPSCCYTCSTPIQVFLWSDFIYSELINIFLGTICEKCCYTRSTPIQAETIIYLF